MKKVGIVMGNDSDFPVVQKTMIIHKEDADTALEILQANDENAYVIGEIVPSEERICLC